MTTAMAGTGRVWFPTAPARGTLVLVPGRGEHPGVYERFGNRLASDGYAVHVIDEDGVEAAVAGASAPVVLAGSDTGALHALVLAGSVAVQGILLAGVPIGNGYAGAGTWERELDARTACPVHRARLTDDAAVRRGSLGEPVPPALARAAERAGTDLPVLLLHGGDDPVSPVAAVRTLARRLPHAELAVVRSGRHDVLNDASHRSVAAHVVLWLERLRTGDTFPILRVEPEP